MTKKQRRSLDDDDGLGFVFGDDGPAPDPDAVVDEPEAPPGPQKQASSKRKAKSKTAAPKPKSSAMSRILQTEEREATVRLTVDMPKSMHQKLTMLSARSGKKKAEIVRLLLDEALADVDD